MIVSMLPIKGVTMNCFEELIQNQGQDKEYFSISEFKFDHIIWNFPKNVNAKYISEMYMQSIEKLDILHKDIGKIYADCGINLVIRASFIMIVPIYRPYESTFGRNLYPDPLWYCGIINLPEIPKKWPETTGQIRERYPFEYLELSSRFYQE